MKKCCLEKRLIGEVLLERRMITRGQLDEALAVQSRSEPGVFLGEILMRLGYISEIDIVTALVLQCNLPYIAVSRHEVDEKVLKLIPKEFALKYRLVPLDLIGGILSVVMQNPMDEKARNEMERQTGCQIAVFISTRDEITQALDNLYSKGL